MKKSWFIFSLALPATFNSIAAPFDTCPSKAFLVQQNKATLFGVNLVTGSNRILASDMGTQGKVNGFGFSVHDRYLYGFGYEDKTIVRIGNDYQIEPLANVVGLPDTNFFVGDVALHENAYFAYRKGADFGLYKVPLNSADTTQTIEASRIVDGQSLNLTIFDMAFHPYSTQAYSVDRAGDLYMIDVVNGVAEVLGNVGESGTFGAVYFDAEGSFYISRNQDGHIFRVDVDSNVPTAELFAFGPSSSNNDGARCATAPIIDEEDISADFGDAPDSYGTSLANNGARHEYNQSGLFLGATVSGEAAPKATDDSDDGVLFVTGLETGLEALVIVNSSAVGYLNAWFDWNQDGQFDTAELGVEGYSLEPGANAVIVDIPIDAKSGETWARFRATEEVYTTAVGGVSNGEVEDYRINVVDTGVTMISYPGAGSWVTLAYEDNWPKQGDYDFNDVVVNYRTTLFKVGGNVVKYQVEGNINAIGADYHNGFGVRFEGIPRAYVLEELVRLRINGVERNRNPLEKNRSEAILSIFDDLWSEASPGEGCYYFRTENGCANGKKVSFSVTLPLFQPVAQSQAPSGLLDPFIFGVNGFSHGSYVNPANARGWEVHMKNNPPTEAFNSGLFGSADDNGSVSEAVYFQTENGLPWGLSVGTNWAHPLEGVDLLDGYPEFREFAESNGAINSLWFHSPVSENVIGQ